MVQTQGNKTPGQRCALRARNAEQLTPVENMTNWRLCAYDMLAINRILRETITDPVGLEFMAPGTREVTPVKTEFQAFEQTATSAPVAVPLTTSG